MGGCCRPSVRAGPPDRSKSIIIFVPYFWELCKQGRPTWCTASHGARTAPPQRPDRNLEWCWTHPGVRSGFQAAGRSLPPREEMLGWPHRWLLAVHRLLGSDCSLASGSPGRCCCCHVLAGGERFICTSCVLLCARCCKVQHTGIHPFLSMQNAAGCSLLQGVPRARLARPRAGPMRPLSTGAPIA